MIFLSLLLGRRGLRFRFFFVLMSGVAQGEEKSTTESSEVQEGNGAHSMSIIYIYISKMSITVLFDLDPRGVSLRFSQMEVLFFSKNRYCI